MISRQLKVGDLVLLEWGQYMYRWIILDVDKHDNRFGSTRETYTVFVVDASREESIGTIRDHEIVSWSGIDRCEVVSLGD
jgi:hypothetical protein